MNKTFEQVMELTRTVSGPAALEDPEALGLYHACCQVPQGGLVVETGCQIGRSSSLIAQMARSIGFHSVHIDPYCTEPPGAASESDKYIQQWVDMMRRIGGEVDHAFTLLCMRTEQAVWHLEKFGPIDLAFIDGDHERPGVEIDLELVGNRVKPGGLLTAHDYGNPGLAGVQAAIDPYVASGKWEPVGVCRSLGIWRRK